MTSSSSLLPFNKINNSDTSALSVHGPMQARVGRSGPRK